MSKAMKIQIYITGASRLPDETKEAHVVKISILGSAPKEEYRIYFDNNGDLSIEADGQLNIRPVASNLIKIS